MNQENHCIMILATLKQSADKSKYFDLYIREQYMKNQHRSVLELYIVTNRKYGLTHCKIYKYRRITTKIRNYWVIVGSDNISFNRPFCVENWTQLNTSRFTLTILGNDARFCNMHTSRKVIDIVKKEIFLQPSTRKSASYFCKY